MTELNCQPLITRQVLYRLTKRAMIGGDAGIRTADKNFYRVRAIELLDVFLSEYSFCYAMLPLHHISEENRIRFFDGL